MTETAIDETEQHDRGQQPQAAQLAQSMRADLEKGNQHTAKPAIQDSAGRWRACPKARKTADRRGCRSCAAGRGRIRRSLRRVRGAGEQYQGPATAPAVRVVRQTGGRISLEEL